ncbi:MAG: hypothetical protein KGL46_02110 [Hyphomicrobiales bacterium]|nr:hypothetical protein [Hyphomicrobiales bacterium]
MQNGKAAAKAPVALTPENAGAMDQVRELLFGEAKRTTEARLDDIDRKIEMLRDDLAARFASLEARLSDQGKDTDRKHAQSIDDIGHAIAQLGETIKGLGQGAGRR